MKKTEIKVGEEYAAGSSSRYDRWKMAHVRVLDLNAQHGLKRGIVVEFVEDSNTYGFYGKTGDPKVLDSARDIRQPWSEYAKDKAEYNEARTHREAERKHKAEVAASVIEALKGYAFYVGTGEYRYESASQHFRFSPERLAELLRVIEQRKAA
jgi:hypothetical protein